MEQDDVVLQSLEAQVAAPHTALVLVDVQNDFVHPDGVLGKGAVPGFVDVSLVPGMLATTRQLLAAARAAGVFTVFVQMIGDLVYQSGPAQALYRRRGGEGGTRSVLDGTWGADFYEDIRPDGRAREVIVRKHRYSAFAGTNLDLVLRSNGIRTLVMCGDATSGCVESTTRHGFFHDYYVVTASDACADFDLARHQASLRKMDESFGYVVPAARVMELWAEAPPAPSGAATALMDTMGTVGGAAPKLPTNGSSEKMKAPPSEATIA